MRSDNTNDRTLDDDSEPSLGTGAQAFALSARRDADVRALVCGVSADTNVISEVRKRDRANKGVCAFFRQAVRDDGDIYLSVVIVAELRRGVELIRHRGDTQQATILEAWLVGIMADYAQNVPSVDEEIGQLWGRLRVPHPEHALDKLIAATALIHDLTVVTRNVDDFAGTGVRLLNPFG